MDRPRRAVVTTLVGTALFGAALALRTSVNPWWTNLAAAIAVIAMVAVTARSDLAARLAVRGRSVAGALALGALMVALTHAAYAIAADVWPALEREVAGLYEGIRRDSPGLAIVVPLTIVVVIAEEVLWRGVVIEALRRRMSAIWTGAIAVALYTAPQLIGGEWVLIAAAISAGTVFTIQRMVSGGLIAPLITHAMWSVSIFGVLPLR